MVLVCLANALFSGWGLNTYQPRRCDKHLYRVRHAVDNFFVKLLRSTGRIAMRYDETACNFLGGVLLALSLIWMRHDW